MLLNDIAAISGVAPNISKSPDVGRIHTIICFVFNPYKTERINMTQKKLSQSRVKISSRFSQKIEKWLKGRAKKTAKMAKWAQMNSKPDFRRFSYEKVSFGDNLLSSTPASPSV